MADLNPSARSSELSVPGREIHEFNTQNGMISTFLASGYTVADLKPFGKKLRASDVPRRKASSRWCPSLDSSEAFLCLGEKLRISDAFRREFRAVVPFGKKLRASDVPRRKAPSRLCRSLDGSEAVLCLGEKLRIIDAFRREGASWLCLSLGSSEPSVPLVK